MRVFESFAALGLVVVSLVVSGCATPQSREVIARSNPAHPVSFTDSIALADRKLRTPELDELKRSVITELLRRGVNLVPADKSDYVLSFWLEDNAIHNPPMLVAGDNPMLTRRFNMPPPDYGMSGTTGTRYTGGPVRIEQSPTPTRGIRMRLFVTKPKSGSLLETAWEGTVDGGADLSARDFDVLIPRLLDHFGSNFNGKVAIAH
jgi:hypothetical protein